MNFENVFSRILFLSKKKKKEYISFLNCDMVLSIEKQNVLTKPLYLNLF